MDLKNKKSDFSENIEIKNEEAFEENSKLKIKDEKIFAITFGDLKNRLKKESMRSILIEKLNF